MLDDETLSPKQLALEWWYETGRNEGNKDTFLADRNQWEPLQAYIHQHCGILPTHDDVKALIRQLDKDGSLAQENMERLTEVKMQKKENRNEFGVPEGWDGFERRVETMHKAVSKDIPSNYNAYLKGIAWRRRSRNYLDEHCTFEDAWVCEICGRRHRIVPFARTIQVHHCDYSITNGKEPNEHLMACCDGVCHQIADIVRKGKSGKLDRSQLADIGRSLLANLEDNDH